MKHSIRIVPYGVHRDLHARPTTGFHMSILDSWLIHVETICLFIEHSYLRSSFALFLSLSLSFSLHAWIYHYNCTFRLLAQFQCSSAPIYNNQHFSDYNCNINSCDLRDRFLRFIRYRRNFNYRSNFPFLNFSRSINYFFIFSNKHRVTFLLFLLL